MWYPANPTERELAWALSGANYPRYFQKIMGAELFVPRRAADEPFTYEVSGRTLLPVFTSDEGMLAIVGDDLEASILTSLDRLREDWPEPEWWLAINPGLPIDAYLPVTAVERAARGELLPQTDPDVIVERLADTDWAAWPPGGVGEALMDAVASGDGAAYLDALLDGEATVPVTREVSEGELQDFVRKALVGRPQEPEFPWSPAGPAPDSAIEAFTAPELCATEYPDLPYVTMKFRVLLWLLPQGRALSVNPGGPAGMELSGEQVPLITNWERGSAVPRPVLLGMRWAQDAGL